MAYRFGDVIVVPFGWRRTRGTIHPMISGISVRRLIGRSLAYRSAAPPAMRYHRSMQAARAFPLSHIDDSRPRPVVAGTDIKVAQIAWEHEYHGMSPDDIANAHPHLSLADIHAALTYFYDHMDAIRADWADTDRMIEEMKVKFPPRERPPRAS